ncbi:MAG: hypothetical protein LUD15_05035 [Bacteroides sp.]|nr:hypothetical protein [Bacteroides sp.]
MQEEAYRSPYKLVSSFGTGEKIEAFELAADKLYIVTPNAVSIYNTQSVLLHNFAIPGPVRDILVKEQDIYLLYPSRIEVYTMQGELLRQLDACSERSNYCSFTHTGNSVYVTDATMKNICQYTEQGAFVRFIQSPNGFVIPSYTFSIEAVGDVIYCSNSGRHLVEKYAPDGTYLGSFGEAGGAPGRFTGCCNPVYLSHTPAGNIITSEKGNPRVSCYGSDGRFHTLLLDSKALGGGAAAYHIRVQDDKVYAAGDQVLSVYHYDPVLTGQTACAAYEVNCPLRKGVKIG